MSAIISSEDSRKAYADRKNQVLELLENTKRYYEQEEDQDHAEVFSNLYHDLENGEFSIVVVGEFSAGKSTLLNALMGKRILPSFSNETTAAVNFLRHSDKAACGEAGKVFYNNGSQEILTDATLETIMKYVSTKGDEVAKKVEHLDLYLDSDFLKDGVTLVDSPGLNGVADGHREITEAQILKSHASIFLFNSDHPGSKTDFEFLHDLQSKVKTIIFVLNKIDEIKADEDETPELVIKTLKETYKEKFPEETTVPEIWPVAAYPALVARNEEPLDYHDKVNRTAEEKRKLEEASRLKDFENRLISFLTCGEKAKQQLLAPVERVIALTVDSRKAYEEEQNLLENSVDTTEIDNQIAGVKESIESLEKQIAGSRSDVTGKIRESIRDLTEELSAKMSRLQENKLSEIDEFNDLDELVDYLASFERSFVGKVHRIALEQEENLRERIITIIKIQFESQAGAIEDKFVNENIDMRLEVSNHLDSGERVFEVGLEEMNKKTKLLEEKLKALSAEAEEKEKDYYRARTLEKKISKLEAEKRKLQDSRETIEAQMLPPIERYTKEVHEKECRGGVLGAVEWFLFGGKDVTRYQLVEDSKEYDAARESKDKRLAQIDAGIAESQDKIERMGEVDSSQAELVYMKKMGEVDAIRKALEDATKENIKKIDDKYKKEIKKIKRELRDYCDNITDDLNGQVKKILRKAENAYIEIVLGTVEVSLRGALNDKKIRLEQLEKQLTASEKDRNARIESLKEKINRINMLIGAASDLQTNLSSIPVDQIKQEMI